MIPNPTQTSKLFDYRIPKKFKHLYKNNVTFYNYYNQLKELALNMFEWKNLPETIDQRYIELNLLERGACVYFNDEVLGNLCLPCYFSAPFNVYNIPEVRTAFAPQGYLKNLTYRDSVLIYNNYLHTDSISPLALFAERLMNIERTIDVNVSAQKTPLIVLCDEHERLSYENMIKQAQDNTLLIMGVKNGMDLNNVTTLNTSAPYVSDKLQILKKQIWNEALTFLGIDNVSTDKKERLVSDEVETNLGGVQAQRFVALNARRQAVEQINKMFKTNIQVNFRMSQETVSMKDYPEEREVVDNGKLYDNA